MYGIIYKITNLLNNKVYIGQTKRKPNVRWRDHKTLRPSNKNMPIAKAIHKYGVENFLFEVVAKAETKEALNILEAENIIKFQSNVKEKGYNVCEVGNGSILWTEERKLEASVNGKLRCKDDEQMIEKMRQVGKSNRGKKTGKTSKYLGVSIHRKTYKGIVKNYWRASIRYKGKDIQVAEYASEEKAAKAYDIAMLKYFGESSPLNFPID